MPARIAWRGERSDTSCPSTATDAARLAQPEDGLQELAPTGAHETGEPDDLAGADVEAHVVERTRQREPAEAEHTPRGGSLLLRRLRVLQRSPHHQVDQPRAVELRRRRRADGVAVAQDREPIGDGEDLVQSVGDEDRGHALLAQAARRDRRATVLRRP